MKPIFFLLVLLIPLSGPLVAQTSATIPHRKTIAVMDFEANNCPQALARALTDLLAGKIFNSSHFILLERNRIDLILRTKQFKKQRSLEKGYAAQLGTLLAVDKIVVGSVSRFDSYSIEVRIIDVKKQTVEMSVSREVVDISGLKECVIAVNTRIDNYYSGYKQLSGYSDLSVSPTVLYLSGGFADNAQTGFGINTAFTFNTLFHDDFPVSLAAGIYCLVPEKSYIDSIYLVPLSITVSYVYTFSDTVRFIPAVGAGYMFSRVTADDYEYRLSGDHQYKTEYYYNPLLVIKSEFNFKVFHGYYLVCCPYYLAFFESRRSNHAAGLDVGVRMLF